jgi:hypothetical protein
VALTITRIYGPVPKGDRFEIVNKVALDNSYPTGGYVLKPSDLGFANAANSDPEFLAEVDSANGWAAVYDYTNQKLKLFSATATTSTEVTNATDVSAAAPRVVAISKYRG